MDLTFPFQSEIHQGSSILYHLHYLIYTSELPLPAIDVYNIQYADVT